MTETGRCKIDEITSDMLTSELVKDLSFSKSASNAKTYYIVTVKDSSISDKPYNGITSYTSLENMIKINGLNSVLFRTSPKVIDI